MRFYGSARVERPLRLPASVTSPTVRWRLAVNRTMVAEGAAQVSEGDPWLRFDVPAVDRTVEAQLALLPEQGEGWTVSVQLHPRPTRLAASFGREPVGWVGSVQPLLVGGETLLLAHARTALEDAGAVRRFRGPLLIVPPTTPVDDVLAAALLDRAAAGATVVAIGSRQAPWVDPEGRVGTPAVRTPFLAGLLSELPPDALRAWGRGDPAWTRPLRPAEGNHAEWVAGLVRVLYPGRGKLVLVQLRLLDDLDDEPLAAELLARLLERARGPAPRLSAPRRVVVLSGALPASVRTLFGSRRGEGPAVVVAQGGDPREAFAKEGPPSVVLGKEGSVFLLATGMKTGPGLDALEVRALKGGKRAELLRFLTAAGLRVKTDRYWR